MRIALTLFLGLVGTAAAIWRCVVCSTMAPPADGTSTTRSVALPPFGPEDTRFKLQTMFPVASGMIRQLPRVIEKATLPVAACETASPAGILSTSLPAYSRRVLSAARRAFPEAAEEVDHGKRRRAAVAPRA